MTTVKRILITPGEPTGIGPDICISIAQQPWQDELVVVADPRLLAERAKQLRSPLQLIEIDPNTSPTLHQPHTLKIIPVLLSTHPAVYVIQTLEIAATLCLQKMAHALVTGPVNKALINDGGIAFKGHTEFFADYCHVPLTVMLFVIGQLKVALATTHLPLGDVPRHITKTRLEATLTLLNDGLKQQFQIKSPRMLVCGLNPHAGENGYLGREEIDVITPTLNKLRQHDINVEGPLSADTIFTPKYLDHADAVLAMFHDQALPLIKYIGFGQAVNVTLGLPFIRTSVDHGTAIDLAGSGKADAGSLEAAIKLALTLQNSHG